MRFECSDELRCSFCLCVTGSTKEVVKADGKAGEWIGRGMCMEGVELNPGDASLNVWYLAKGKNGKNARHRVLTGSQVNEEIQGSGFHRQRATGED